jgi:hypothetical protein
MTTFYNVQAGAPEDAGISDNARSVLADLLLRHDQGCTPAIYFVVLSSDGTIVEPTVAKRLWRTKTKYHRASVERTPMNGIIGAKGTPCARAWPQRGS